MKKKNEIIKGYYSLFILGDNSTYKNWLYLGIQELIGLISLIIIYNSGLYLKYSENFFMTIYLSIFLLTLLTFGFSGNECFYLFLYIFQILGIIFFNFPLSKHNLFHICFYMYLFSLLCDYSIMIYLYNSKYPSFPYLFLISFITIITIFGIFCIFYWDLHYFIGVLLSIFNIYSILISYCILDHLEMTFDDLDFDGTNFSNIILIRCLQFFPIGSLLFYFGIFLISMTIRIWRYQADYCCSDDEDKQSKAKIILIIFYIFAIPIFIIVIRIISQFLAYI